MDSQTPRNRPREPGESAGAFAPRVGRAANAAARYLLFGVAFFIVAGTWVWYAFARSDYLAERGVPMEQPVMFSHRHHAGDLGIDCRYCHASVDDSPFAGIPSTETCMTCHSQLFTDSPMLAPVRESFQTGLPIAWNRVHDLPEFVFFDHSIHMAKGLDCTQCHGDVADMPLVSKRQPLSMQWCLDCHRETEPTASAGTAPHPINPLTNCYACHR